jgi:hypothetical protein
MSPLRRQAGPPLLGKGSVRESQPLRHQRPLSDLAQHGREQGRCIDVEQWLGTAQEI